LENVFKEVGADFDHRKKRARREKLTGRGKKQVYRVGVLPDTDSRRDVENGVRKKEIG